MILPPPTYKTLASSYKVLSCPSPVNPHAHYSRGKHHSGLFSSMPKFSCFRISYKWNRIVCILFGKASFTLSLIVRFIQVLFICSSFFFFYRWVVFHCVDIPDCPASWWWTPGLIPVWSYYEYSCTSIFVDICFHFSWVNT